MVVQAEVEVVTIRYHKIGPPTLRMSGRSDLGPVGIEEVMPPDFDRVIRDLVNRHAVRKIA